MNAHQGNPGARPFRRSKLDPRNPTVAYYLRTYKAEIEAARAAGRKPEMPGEPPDGHSQLAKSVWYHLTKAGDIKDFERKLAEQVAKHKPIAYNPAELSARMERLQLRTIDVARGTGIGDTSVSQIKHGSGVFSNHQVTRSVRKVLDFIEAREKAAADAEHYPPQHKNMPCSMPQPETKKDPQPETKKDPEPETKKDPEPQPERSAASQGDRPGLRFTGASTVLTMANRITATVAAANLTPSEILQLQRILGIVLPGTAGDPNAN